MVYDFGSGAFDAAVIEVSEGFIEVVTHAGNNMLGSRDIDWAIVEQLLIPALGKNHGVTGISRANTFIARRPRQVQGRRYGGKNRRLAHLRSPR